MIIGIGTDICDIRRIENSIEKYGERFIRRIYTAHEIAYCEGKSGRASYYAKRFAAKEAAAKALAGPNTGSLSWHDVEVQNEVSGKPVLKLSGEALARKKAREATGAAASIHLSMSDDYPYAQAFVVFEVNHLDTE